MMCRGWNTQYTGAPQHFFIKPGCTEKFCVDSMRVSHLGEYRLPRILPDDSHYFCALVLFSLVTDMSMSSAEAIGIAGLVPPQGLQRREFRRAAKREPEHQTLRRLFQGSQNTKKRRRRLKNRGFRCRLYFDSLPGIKCLCGRTLT
jgi:hypothetical protein